MILKSKVILDQGHHGLINEMNLGMNHALGAGSITQPVQRATAVQLMAPTIDKTGIQYCRIR